MIVWLLLGVVGKVFQMKRWSVVACFVLVALMASFSFAQSTMVYSNHIDLSSFNLAPGETLVSVNGVPVSTSTMTVQTRGPIANLAQTAVNVVEGISSRIVNRDAAAYNHALREAQILASRRGSGHPLGVAPGCSYAGTGTSFSAEQPNHCYAREMPESRLVARAVVRGSDGRYYWSAHYR